MGSKSDPEMEKFDEEIKDSQGNDCPRDLVQYVRFEDFNIGSGSIQLSNAVLEELPEQIMEYYKGIGVDPMKKKKSFFGAVGAMMAVQKMKSKI